MAWRAAMAEARAKAHAEWQAEQFYAQLQRASSDRVAAAPCVLLTCLLRRMRACARRLWVLPPATVCSLPCAVIILFLPQVAPFEEPHNRQLQSVASTLVTLGKCALKQARAVQLPTMISRIPRSIHIFIYRSDECQETIIPYARRKPIAKYVSINFIFMRVNIVYE
eukprot:g3922.t1